MFKEIVSQVVWLNYKILIYIYFLNFLVRMCVRYCTVKLLYNYGNFCVVSCINKDLKYLDKIYIVLV
jgi:hypothetical protein